MSARSPLHPESQATALLTRQPPAPMQDAHGPKITPRGDSPLKNVMGGLGGDILRELAEVGMVPHYKILSRHSCP